jgi:hypothetical protein
LCLSRLLNIKFWLIFYISIVIIRFSIFWIRIILNLCFSSSIIFSYFLNFSHFIHNNAFWRKHSIWTCKLSKFLFCFNHWRAALNRTSKIVFIFAFSCTRHLILRFQWIYISLSFNSIFQSIYISSRNITMIICHCPFITSL